eukprot:TRINITY_DN3901_c0_g1_i1.p2 TRINITY_DN3901_c0_g1~~TRINITY_DN3901_c0_g1_i1.p2  ORF type:complete len:115 (+),score=21.28 TRINITY_DN3901_c0_g1_i1:1281-1625(+)
MWDWMQKEGSFFLPIFFPKNFEEYLRILWDHTSYVYLCLILASILLALLTLKLTKQIIVAREGDGPGSFTEDVVKDIDMNDPNVISLIKKAQTRRINKKIEANMSSDEVAKESE